MNSKASLDRRAFLKFSAAAVSALPFASIPVLNLSAATPVTEPRIPAEMLSNARVAITRCTGYGPEVRTALKESFDLLGGISGLVRNKTVTIKLNLTGTDFTHFLGRPVGETFMTHESTALALAGLVLEAGARRVRFVESTQSKSSLQGTLDLADWDIQRLSALGRVEFENTRNLGSGNRYAHLKVPGGGFMFSSLDLNESYEKTDVMISLAKLKNHITAGVTLSLKNLFGITPNSLYGDQAGNEDATAGRGPLHNPRGFDKIQLPGLKPGPLPNEPVSRIPRILVDVCTARPIHLAVIDGITSMSGGEGPWCRVNELKLTKPGVLIVGLNPVSADAVGTAVMGYQNPRAKRGEKPFDFCENHLLLAEEAGLGTADLSRIDVRGLPLARVVHPYRV